MDDARKDSYRRILFALEHTALTDAHKRSLRSALEALFAARPNAPDKVDLPLGRALRNPTFPDIWRKCIEHLPKSDDYADLRAIAAHIEASLRT